MPNELEESVRSALERKGCTVLRNGWPDFMVMLSDRRGNSPQDYIGGFALEVKNHGDTLSDEQTKMHCALRKFGVPVLVARNNFEAVLRKRGRALLTPMSREAVRNELNELHLQIRLLLQRWNSAVDDLALLQCLFDDCPVTDARCLVESFLDASKHEFLQRKESVHEFGRRCLPMTFGCLPEYEI